MVWARGVSKGESGVSWGLSGALPRSSRTRGRGSGLGALWLGKRGGGEGTGEMLSGWRGLASEKRGGGLALVRVGEGER